MRHSETLSETDHSNTFNLINMYFEEWKYRHENFWRRLTQFAVVTFFTTTLPITFRMFNALELPDIPMLLFPISGVFLALLNLWFCLSENVRMVAVDRTIRELIRQRFGNQYLKRTLPTKRFERLYKLRIGLWFPVVMTALQIALAFLVIWMICVNKI